jgi:hypothetical protein
MGNVRVAFNILDNDQNLPVLATYKSLVNCFSTSSWTSRARLVLWQGDMWQTLLLSSLMQVSSLENPSKLQS